MTKIAISKDLAWLIGFTAAPLNTNNGYGVCITRWICKYGLKDFIYSSIHIFYPCVHAFNKARQKSYAGLMFFAAPLIPTGNNETGRDPIYIVIVIKQALSVSVKILDINTNIPGNRDAAFKLQRPSIVIMF